MVVCPNCATENPDTNAFCGNCGTALEVACPACGTTNPPGNSFCGSCGGSLTEIAPSESGPEDPPVASERRLVSVLFADLTGFTPFSEARDPEEVRGFLTEYFDRSREVIEAFGGVVDKFIGDAVMAVWGAREAKEDDAERAVRAGLELTDAISNLGVENGVPELAIRVGVLTGEASVGPGGNEQGLVVGDMVNTASRLQSIADPGTVLVGESTRRAIGEAIAFTALGDHPVKGKEMPVAVWRAERLLGLVGSRAGNGMESPFVGRVDELRLLKDMYAAVGRENRTRLVSIIGQGGIGKSRLMQEFENYLDGIVDTVYWHEGRSPAYGDGVTLWALGEMVRRRAHIAETDDVETTRKLLRDAIGDWIADEDEADWLEPRLASLLGVGDSVVGDQAELFAAFRTFFERIAERGVAVLIFDDLHWADPALLDFVEQLPEWSRNHRILVITLARPDLLERRSGWGQGKHGFVSLHLGPLADVDMRLLVDGMAPGATGDIREAIVDRAAGIPLYAVEMIRMMIAGGDLVETDGAYSFTGALSDLAVPESLQAVIGARIDRLEPADRSLLQDCAVVGHSFTLDTLAHVTGHSEDDLADRLLPLIREGMLVVDQDPRSPERGQYQFVQSLIREVAHGRISREVRKQRHLEVAGYLEQLGPELAVVVASHYLDAYRAASGVEADDLRSVARDSLLGAADRAADLNSSEQARSLAERALVITGDNAERAPIWERIATAASVLADPEVAVANAEQAIEYYRESDDATGLNRAVRLLGDAYNGANQSKRAIELLEAHLADQDLSTDPNLAIAASDLARAYLLTNAPRLTTAAAAEAALPALEQFALTDSIAQAMITRGTALGSLGRIRQGLALIKGALELADREGLAATSIRGRINLSYVGSTEDPVMGFRATREAYDIAKRNGQRTMVLFLTWSLAGWHETRGELDEAEAFASDPILEGAPTDYRAQNLGIQADIADLRGDRELGRELFEQARPLYEQSEDVQVRQDFERLQHNRAVVEGRFEEAFEGSVRLARDPTTPTIYVIRAARNAAILTGNVGWLQVVLDVCREAGVLARYHTRMAETMLSFLENPSTDTLHRAGLLVEEVEDNEMVLEAVALCTSLALHAPPGPQQEHWENELRARCDKHGLTGVLDMYNTLGGLADRAS